jgi:hypothetical protein
MQRQQRRRDFAKNVGCVLTYLITTPYAEMRKQHYEWPVILCARRSLHFCNHVHTYPMSLTVYFCTH